MAGTWSHRDSQPPHNPAKTILVPALQIGGLSGAAGFVFGGVAGTIRSETPRIFAIASSLQWAALGSTFWLTRGGISHAWEISPSSPPQERVTVSAAAGAVTGGLCGGVLRGRRNIIPGIIMFTLFGYLGQTIFNILDARHTQQMYQAATEDRDNTSFWRRIANSKYSPMKVLSNEEYEKILQKKLLRVEAEIAVIDDDIEKLKASSPKEKVARSEKNGSVTEG